MKGLVTILTAAFFYSEDAASAGVPPFNGVSGIELLAYIPKRGNLMESTLVETRIDDSAKIRVLLSWIKGVPFKYKPEGGTKDAFGSLDFCRIRILRDGDVVAVVTQHGSSYCKLEVSEQGSAKKNLREFQSAPRAV